MKPNCYLCGSEKSLTEDHVPPRNLFPKPRPGNLIVIDCCRDCNNSFSKDDEAFMLWISFATKSESGKWIHYNKTIKSTLKRNKKLAINLQYYFARILINDNGKLSRNFTLGIPENRATAYLVRVTKGLIRNFYPEFDYSKVWFGAYHLNSSSPHFADYLDKVSSVMTYDRRGNGVFEFWRGEMDSLDGFMWVYRFYESQCFLVYVHPIPNFHKKSLKIQTNGREDGFVSAIVPWGIFDSNFDRPLPPQIRNNTWFLWP